MQDMIREAKKAVEDNLRHSEETLRERLWEWFPEASDDEIEQAIGAAL